MAVLGTVSMVLAVVAHRAGGGALPAVGLLLVSTLVVGLAAVAVTGRRIRFPLLVGLLAVEQFVLHVAFSTTSGVGAVCAPMVGGHHAGLGDGCLAAPGALDGAMAMPGWGMWVGHAAAVIATAWLLARGESWLWRTADRIVGAANAAPTRRRRAARSTPPTAPAFSLVATGHAPAAPRGPPVLFGC